jgi:hypothetical protein
MFITQPGTVSSADLDDVVIASLAYWNDLKAGLSSSYTLSNITVTDVSVANGTQVILPLVTDNTGAVTGVAAAANAACCISLRTNFTGRSFRGRFYVGGLPQEALLNAQSLQPSAAAAYAGFMEDFITAVSALGKTLVVVSNYAAGVVRVIALATEIISVIVDTKVDSQRRRTAN